MTVQSAHLIDSSVIHRAWDNSLSPRTYVEPGEIVTFQVRQGMDGFLTPESTADDLARGLTFVGHPLTGPVFVRGAMPGDVLQVEVLEIELEDWGATMIMPGLGLLQEDFTKPYLKIWDISNRTSAMFKPGIQIPLEPFCGVMGLALAEPGAHSTLPPRRVGGNLDVKQLTAGSKLLVPVEVEGALFSLGDAHAAQGDGEVCVTAIETGFKRVVVRFDVKHAFSIEAPEYRTGPLAPNTNAAGWYATTGVAPDLMVATREAVRNMIRYLGREYDLSPEEAYVLSSVTVDLKISEVVDAPNWVVSAFLPLGIFSY